MTIGKELERIFDKLKSQIKVAIPCEVVKYDHAKQVVEVKTENGKIIPNIPIFQMTNNGVSGLFVPVSKGCYGALLSFDEDLSAYINNAKSSYTTRKHDISDSYFIAGFTPKGSRLTLAEGKCGLKNDNMSVILHANGKIEIKNSTAELLAQIVDILGKIKDALITPGVWEYVNAGGITTPCTANEVTSNVLSAQLQAIITKIESMKV